MTSLRVISGLLIVFLAVGQCSALRVEREERRQISVAGMLHFMGPSTNYVTLKGGVSGQALHGVGFLGDRY